MATTAKRREEPAWHPNFRIAEELPDIKPVRTAFLINIITVAAALGGIAFYAYVSLQIGQVDASNERLRQEIADIKPSYTAKVKRNRTFGELEKRLNDVNRFYETRYELLPIVRALSDACPDNIFYRILGMRHVLTTKGRKRNFDERSLVIELDCVLQIEDAREDLNRVTAFVDELESLPILAEVLAEISEPNPRKIPGQDRYEFGVRINLKALQ